MLHSVSNIHGCSLSLGFAVCLSFVLLLNDRHSEASLYHKKGICSYKDKYYKPGDSFHRGCDKCLCHDSGFYCVTPKKPTSWPKKCHRVRTQCGYTVVYKENPLVKCRAHSWIG